LRFRSGYLQFSLENTSDPATGWTPYPKKSIQSVLVAVLMGCVFGCHRPYADTVVEQRAELSTAWTTIRAEQPLDWSPPIEELSFQIDSPHKISNSGGLFLVDGTRCEIEVELVASDASKYPMEWHGFLDGDMYFTFPHKPAGMRTVEAFRVRSNAPLTISNIRWRGYDPTRVSR
jgi:hypothetical protein